LGIHYDKFNRKVFEGEFKKNLACGDGIVFFKQNFNGKKARHEGKFKDGLAHG
jgi:hypothetical protein